MYRIQKFELQNEMWSLIIWNTGKYLAHQSNETSLPWKNKEGPPVQLEEKKWFHPLTAQYFLHKLKQTLTLIIVTLNNSDFVQKSVGNSHKAVSLQVKVFERSAINSFLLTTSQRGPPENTVHCSSIVASMTCYLAMAVLLLLAYYLMLPSNRYIGHNINILAIGQIC
jgi:hypothetical protein